MGVGVRVGVGVEGSGRGGEGDGRGRKWGERGRGGRWIEMSEKTILKTKTNKRKKFHSLPLSTPLKSPTTVTPHSNPLPLSPATQIPYHCHPPLKSPTTVTPHSNPLPLSHPTQLTYPCQPPLKSPTTVTAHSPDEIYTGPPSHRTLPPATHSCIAAPAVIASAAPCPDAVLPSVTDNDPAVSALDAPVEIKI